MSVKRPAFQTKLNPALAIRVNPLGDRELQVVQHFVDHVAPDWSVELYGAGNYDASLIVLPDDGDDDNGPSFAISRETFGLRLDQVHWDELTEIGVFASMPDLLEAMSVVVASWSGLPGAASVTIH